MCGSEHRRPLGVIGGIALGYLASRLLYRPLHRRDAPELARYTIGGLLIAAVLGLIRGGDGLADGFAAAAAVGTGVGAARVVAGLGENIHDG